MYSNHILSNTSEEIYMKWNAPDSEFSMQLSCVFSFSMKKIALSYS